jgi:hypothetical protein
LGWCPVWDEGRAALEKASDFKFVKVEFWDNPIYIYIYKHMGNLSGIRNGSAAMLMNTRLGILILPLPCLVYKSTYLHVNSVLQRLVLMNDIKM